MPDHKAKSVHSTIYHTIKLCKEKLNWITFSAWPTWSISFQSAASALYCELAIRVLHCLSHFRKLPPQLPSPSWLILSDPFSKRVQAAEDLRRLSDGGGTLAASTIRSLQHCIAGVQMPHTETQNAAKVSKDIWGRFTVRFMWHGGSYKSCEICTCALQAVLKRSCVCFDSNPRAGSTCLKLILWLYYYATLILKDWQVFSLLFS